MVKVVFEKDMQAMCKPGSVICMEVIKMSEVDGKIVVEVDACVFQSNSGRSGDLSEKTPEPEAAPPPTPTPAPAPMPVPAPAPMPVPAFEKKAELGDLIDLTALSMEEPRSTDTTAEQDIAVPSPVALEKTEEIESALPELEPFPPLPEKTEQLPVQQEPLPPVQEVKAEVDSLFGERGPSLFGVEEAKKPVVEKQPSVSPGSMEIVLTKERFYELLDAIDVSGENASRRDGDGVMTRDQAVAAERAGKIIRTNFIAYVRNKAKGKLYINDLQVGVPYMDILNLGSMSAASLKGSSDLYELLSAGILEFVSQQEAKSIREKTEKRLEEKVLAQSAAEESFDSMEEALQQRRRPKRRDGRKLRKSSEYGTREFEDSPYGDDFEEEFAGEYDPEAVAVNHVPSRMARDVGIFVTPDKVNELDRVSFDLGEAQGSGRFAEDW
jgi:hypothetical protein